MGGSYKRRDDSDKRRRHLRAEADLAAMWPQVREIWEAPGAGKGEDEGHSGDFAGSVALLAP